jgi:hypothetical protein
MAYSETRSISIKKRANEDKTLTTSGVGTGYIVVGVPAGVTAVTAQTIEGVSANLTATLDASNFTVTLWATAGTFAVSKDDVIVLTLTQQKQYGLEKAYGVDHTVTHP